MRPLRIGVVYQLKLDEEKVEVKGEAIVCGVCVYFFLRFLAGGGKRR